VRRRDYIIEDLEDDIVDKLKILRMKTLEFGNPDDNPDSIHEDNQ
jgi:hypothetical protein